VTPVINATRFSMDVLFLIRRASPRLRELPP
jgi:hypothetical protein